MTWDGMLVQVASSQFVHEPAACEIVIGSQFLDSQVETSPTRRAECYYSTLERRRKDDGGVC